MGGNNMIASHFLTSAMPNEAIGAVQKDIGFFLAVFDTPLPNVGILTLIYPISTF